MVALCNQPVFSLVPAPVGARLLAPSPAPASPLMPLCSRHAAVTCDPCRPPPARPADTTWMSQPCRSSCMNGTFTPY